jgi:hypothetical protein
LRFDGVREGGDEWATLSLAVRVNGIGAATLISWNDEGAGSQ